MDSNLLSFLLWDTDAKVDLNEAVSGSSSEDNSNNENYVSLNTETSPHSNDHSCSSPTQQPQEMYPKSSSKEKDTGNKRKRQDVKTKCEANRRNRFNEQLELLRSILSASQKNANVRSPNLTTRDEIMKAAIHEIMQLRQGMLHMNQMLLNAQQAFVMQQLPVDQSLQDPFNRTSYSSQDLERAFFVMFARQVILNQTFVNHKTFDEVFSGMKMLEDVTKQLGKPEHQLNVAVMEQTYYSCLRCSPKDLARSLDHSWITYQDCMKTRKEGIFQLDADMGGWILNHMLMMEYAIGNLDAFEYTHGYMKDYLKRFLHAGTHQFLLAQLIATFRGSIALPVAKRIYKILEPSFWSSPGKIILGTAMLETSAHEGLELIERGLAEQLAIGKGQDSIHLLIAQYILSAYIITRCVNRGLALANYTLQKFEESQMEAYLGKAEIMRLKAVLLMLKKYPDFIPEPQTWRDATPFVSEVVALCESIPRPVVPPKPAFGPLPFPHMLIAEPSQAEEEDIELLIRSALERAYEQGLVIVELRCSVDLVRYYLHIGDMEKARTAVLGVKEVMSRMRASDDTGEIRRAQFVCSLVDPF